MMLPVYPDASVLPGLGWSQKWSPEFFNMKTETTATGADIDLALAQYPLHNFELTYDFLRDKWFWSSASLEFKTMMGFFLMMSGSVGRFLFRNTDDHFVAAQAIGTGDGTTVTFGPISAHLRRQRLHRFGAGRTDRHDEAHPGPPRQHRPAVLHLDAQHRGTAQPDDHLRLRAGLGCADHHGLLIFLLLQVPRQREHLREVHGPAVAVAEGADQIVSPRRVTGEFQHGGTEDTEEQ